MKCIVNVFDRSFVRRVSDEQAAEIVAPQIVRATTGSYGGGYHAVPSAWEYAPKSAWKASGRSTNPVVIIPNGRGRNTSHS
jgi:hypothetical protein